MVRAFALEFGRLGSFLSRVKPKTLKLVSAVTLAKRSAIKCSAEDEMNREQNTSVNSRQHVVLALKDLNSYKAP